MQYERHLGGGSKRHSKRCCQSLGRKATLRWNAPPTATPLTPHEVASSARVALWDMRLLPDKAEPHQRPGKTGNVAAKHKDIDQHVQEWRIMGHRSTVKPLSRKPVTGCMQPLHSKCLRPTIHFSSVLSSTNHWMAEAIILKCPSKCDKWGSTDRDKCRGCCLGFHQTSGAHSTSGKMQQSSLLNVVNRSPPPLGKPHHLPRFSYPCQPGAPRYINQPLLTCFQNSAQCKRSLSWHVHTHKRTIFFSQFKGKSLPH